MAVANGILVALDYPEPMPRMFGQMKIKPIKSEKEYQAALKSIQKLWDAKPNTNGGDSLEILITLGEAYEVVHYSIDAPDPIEVS